MRRKTGLNPTVFITGRLMSAFSMRFHLFVFVMLYVSNEATFIAAIFASYYILS